jgi:hypothetical protein
MSRARVTILAAALASVVARPGKAEDLTIVSRVTSPHGTTRTQTQYLASNRIRISDPEWDFIVDTTTGRIRRVDDRRKEYSETSLDDLRAFLDQTEAAMAGRPLFDRSVGATASVTVARGAAPRTIAAHATEPYTLTMGDAVRVEVWMAPALEAPPRYFDARKVPYAMMGPMGWQFDHLLDAMKTIGGLPLAMDVDFRLRTVRRQVKTEALEVKKGPIADAAFTLPPDYKKVEAPFERRGREERRGPPPRAN